MPFATSERLQQLPPYLFVEIDRLKREAIEKGTSIINLGLGDPDLPTPKEVVEALCEAAHDTSNHQYPLGIGSLQFRTEVADYYERIHGVTLNADTEVMALIGSKEGIGHLPLAVVNPGETVLIPEPGYPVYRSAAIFAGGVPYAMPLRPENRYLPDLDAIPADVYARTKLMFLNYPNNPTSALADEEFFARVVAKAKQHGFIVAHDAAYLDIVYGGEDAVSFLEIPGAKDVGIEIHSLSKTFNMTGWRIGFAAGDASLIAALAKLKNNLDSGVFGAVQRAGVIALRNYEKLLPELLKTYEWRVAALSDGFDDIGWDGYQPPKGTFYAWLPVRGGRSSMEMTKLLIEQCGIVSTPGIGFGEHGEGYIRFALTTDEKQIREGMQRLAEAGLC